RAHPRVGGENQAHAVTLDRVTGSSPRRRGKPKADYPTRRSDRLIPA
ncbi:hypothetical protein HMPREF1980_02372, partial [Actinomyces sp. oral taxon 172 str. F0311]